MTRNPWEVGANYLLLPAPRQALQRIYRGDTMDERFEFVAQVPGTDMKVYRIKPADR